VHVQFAFSSLDNIGQAVVPMASVAEGLAPHLSPAPPIELSYNIRCDACLMPAMHVEEDDFPRVGEGRFRKESLNRETWRLVSAGQCHIHEALRIAITKRLCNRLPPTPQAAYS